MVVCKIPLCRLLLCLLVGSATTHPIAAADDWGSWRGGNQAGASDSKLPTQWTTSSNVAWKVKVPGAGSSTPVVAGDKIFLTTAIKTDQQGPQAQVPVAEPPAARGGRSGRRGRGGMNNPQPTNVYRFVVMAISRDTGKVLWQKTVHEAVPHEPGHRTNTFASGSPVTDGKYVYASFGSDGIYCLTVAGDLVWQRQLGKMTTRNSFGEGASPALYGETLIIPWDHDGYTDQNGNGVRDDGELDSSVFALDTKTGDTRWQVKRPSEPTTWATPLITEFDGVTQVILNGTTVRSYDMRDGSELWHCGGQVTNPIPSPVRYQDSVICMTGYRGNAIYAIDLGSRGDAQPTALWKRNDAAPYVASPTMYSDVLYLTKGLNGIMTSVDAATGETIIPQTRLTEIPDCYASPVAASGHVYFTSREGKTVVVAHGKEFQQVAVNDLEEPIDASPVIAGDALLIRTATQLYCISAQ